MAGLLGSPVLANATQAEASRSAITFPVLRPEPTMLERTMWNEASTSWPCTAPNLRSNAGVAHAQMYIQVGAPPSAARRSPCVIALQRFVESVIACAWTRYGDFSRLAS